MVVGALIALLPPHVVHRTDCRESSGQASGPPGTFFRPWEDVTCLTPPAKTFNEWAVLAGSAGAMIMGGTLAARKRFRLSAAAIATALIGSGIVAAVAPVHVFVQAYTLPLEKVTDLCSVRDVKAAWPYADVSVSCGTSKVTRHPDVCLTLSTAGVLILVAAATKRRAH